ncbi:putative surfactin synthetase domain protein, partial [Vibrio parahaemolyticus VP2007-007]
KHCVVFWQQLPICRWLFCLLSRRKIHCIAW